MDIIKTTISNEIEVQHVFHAKPSKGDNYAIYLRFYILLKSIRIAETTVSTGVTTSKSKWSKEGTIKGTDIVAKTKNERLRKLLEIVHDGLHELKKLKIKNVSVISKEIEQGLKIKITNKPRKGEKSKYLSKIVEHNLTAVKDGYLSTIPGRSETYKKNFRLAVQKFGEWWQHSYSTTILPSISEITAKDIKLFKGWCEKQNITHNTATTYLNRLRTIFNYAVGEKLITESPIPKKGLIEGYKNGPQIALTTSELIKFKNIPDFDLSETMKMVKYIFMFLCSTGMGYGELKSLRLEHIEKDGDELSITKERNKSGVVFHLPLSETAKHIYTNYLNPIHDKEGQPFENLPSIEYVTRKVKILAAMAGINKNISTYVGRKTFATQWANDGNNIYYLSMILGHTDIKRTMDYVKYNKLKMLEYAREAYKRNAFHAMN